jgi:hypothetical protein
MATQPTDPKPRPAAPSAIRVTSPRGRDAAVPPDDSAAYVARALLLWPGLDRGRLASTHGDPVRITRLVARRTALPPETILRMLGVRVDLLPTIEGPARDD